MHVNDPELPECLRMDPPGGIPDDANALQRTMSMVSLDASNQERPPTQVVSVSDDDLAPKSGDWADQMQQDSEERRALGRVSV